MNNKRWGIKIAILLTSTDFTVSLAMLTPILGYIAQQFPDGGTKISLLMTLPMLIMVPTVIITAKLCDYVSKKTLLIIGTVIFSFGGMAGGFFDNLSYMLVTRAILGIGAGMLFSLPQSFIVHLFEGKERASMQGWAGGMGAFVSIFAGLLAGAVGLYNWHYSLYLHALYLLLIIPQVLLLPNFPPEKKDASLHIQGESKKMGWRPIFFMACVIAIFCNICYFTLYLSTFIMNEGIGTSVDASYVSSTCTLASFVICLVFGALYGKIKRGIPIFSLLLLIACYSLFASAHSIVNMYLAAICMGFACGVIGPYFMSRIAMTVPKSKQTMGVSLISISVFLGQFSGTYYAEFLKSFMGDSMRAVLWGSTITLVVMLVFALIYVPATRKVEGKVVTAALADANIAV